MVADRDVIFDRPDGRLRGHHRRRRRATYAAGFAESLSRPETRAWHEQAAGHVRLHERDLSFRARWNVKLSRNPPGVAACFSRLAAWHVPGAATGSKLFETHPSPAAAGGGSLRLAPAAAWRKRHSSAHLAGEVRLHLRIWHRDLRWVSRPRHGNFPRAGVHAGTGFQPV